MADESTNEVASEQPRTEGAAELPVLYARKPQTRADLKAEIACVDSEIESRQSEIEELQYQLEDLQEEIVDMKNQCETFEKKLDDLGDDNDDDEEVVA